MRGGAEVVDIDLVSQALAARCTHGDEALPRGARMGCHGGLGLDLVAGVDDGVGARGQQAQPVVRVNEVVDAVHAAGGVDLGDALAHGFDLGLAHGGGECMDLAV